MVTTALAPIQPIQTAHSNFRETWNLAKSNPAVMREAWEWYPQMLKFVKSLKRKHGKRYPHMSLFDWCCYVSILSPRVSVEKNMLIAETLAKHGPGILDTDFIIMGTKAHQRKAARILQGESGIDVLKYQNAEKTYNFARDIFHANEFRQHCTLDGWMLKIAGWHKKAMSTLEYESLEWAIVTIGYEENIPPMIIQAAKWIVTRRKAW